MCALRSDVSTAGQHAIAALWDAPLAPLAQLDRALPSEGRGQRFESSRVRHLSHVHVMRICAVKLINPIIENKVGPHVSSF